MTWARVRHLWVLLYYYYFIIHFIIITDGLIPQVKNHFDISNIAKETVETVVDGETQEVWPKCAAWFLGPKVSTSLVSIFFLK